MQILSHLEFPYFDAFTLGAIKEFAQQLLSFEFFHENETLSMRKRLPKGVPTFTKPLPQDLPYLEPFVFKVSTLQWLIPFDIGYELEILQHVHTLPKANIYLPKLSRYKD